MYSASAAFARRRIFSRGRGSHSELVSLIFFKMGMLSESGRNETIAVLLQASRKGWFEISSAG